MFVSDLYDRVAAIDWDNVAVQSMRATSGALVAKNREQLMEGKRRDGQDLTPSYFDDPYFKTRQAAQRYSAWKDRITPNPKRKRGTPNLYINGFLHRSIKLELNNDKLVFGVWRQAEIEAKWTDFIFGLNTEKRTEYLNESLRPVFNNRIEKLTGLKFDGLKFKK